MLFASLQYLIFLPTVVLLYWLLPHRFRLPMLLAASWYFYMCWIPAFLVLIVSMTALNFFWGRWLYRAQSHRKLIFSSGIAVNLLCLGIFKYANFFGKSAASLAGWLTGNQPDWSLNIILPLAISFFTFEFIHYLFEIHRGRKPIDSFVLFALFAAFFPTQIAGPIKRYPDFEAQMQADAGKRFKLSMVDNGIPLIVLGLAKKVLLADNLAVFVQMGLADPYSYGAPELWFFAYAFAFQIYFDFSGYTDIARGSAMLFGYKIPINFNMPYIARNVADFWHRWHISLSTWLRDYLFIPLGGSRGGRWLTHRNLFLTMALGGLWHGASWNFVVWGIYQGMALIVHKEFSLLAEKITALKGFFASKLWHYFAVILTFHVVCVGWIFFRVENIGQAFGIVKRMVLLRPFYSPIEAGSFLMLKPDLPLVVPALITMVAVLLILNIPVSKLNESGQFKKSSPALRAAFCSLLILLMVIFLPDTSQPFIYFQF
ncbi:MAG: MBOAT family protein [Candidatus Melainabacteria bacterium]|nr:MBOAT family protein [Candidatus Melainabacteria bacterium]